MARSRSRHRGDDDREARDRRDSSRQSAHGADTRSGRPRSQPRRADSRKGRGGRSRGKDVQSPRDTRSARPDRGASPAGRRRDGRSRSTKRNGPSDRAASRRRAASRGRGGKGRNRSESRRSSRSSSSSSSSDSFPWERRSEPLKPSSSGFDQRVSSATDVAVRARAAQLSTERVKPAPLAAADMNAVDAFLANNRVEPHAAIRMRALSPELQKAVIAEGVIKSARDPSAVLIGRIRRIMGIGPDCLTEF
mmetsp:Transcript_81950/g.228410  ORF Transcript_81950/g.228410 Transcript_81950/m.228410 type:complete len:250 (-) Transcript_81950:111-860(-)